MNSEDALREALAITDDCPKLGELLDNEQSSALQGHVSQCPHCRAELALFAGLEQPADFNAVHAISKRLASVNWAEAGRRGIAAPSPGFWERLSLPRFLAPASLALASAMLLLTFVQTRHPAAKDDFRSAGKEMESQALRSGQLRGLAPLGEIGFKPGQFRWEAMAGAEQYEINLMEVDHKSVWRRRVSANSANIPAQEAEKMLPGKRMLWEVKAFGAAGEALASSGTLEFTRSLQPAHK